MTELGSVAWPPAPIKTERLMLRATESRDRAAFIELLASPEVHIHLGGPQPRDELERTLSEAPGQQQPGLFVIDLDGTMIGMVELKRYVPDAEQVRQHVGRVELGYLLLPEAWGRGYATEACVAALGWFTDERPGEPVILCTQTANEHSMRLAAKLGFTEVERFEAYGAKQWLGVWAPPTPAG